MDCAAGASCCLSARALSLLLLCCCALKVASLSVEKRAAVTQFIQQAVQGNVVQASAGFRLSGKGNDGQHCLWPKHYIFIWRTREGAAALNSCIPSMHAKQKKPLKTVNTLLCRSRSVSALLSLRYKSVSLYVEPDC